MQETDIRYCLECGSPIVDNYGFCPACGWIYEKPKSASNGSSNVRTEPQQGPSQDEAERARLAYQQYAEAYRKKLMENQMKLNLFMLVVWIVMSAVASVGLFFGIGSLEPYISTGLGLGNHAVPEAMILGISCAFAVVSFVTSILRKFWQISLYTCLASAFTTVGLIWYGDTICIYLFLFGLLASLRVKNIRAVYKS